MSERLPRLGDRADLQVEIAPLAIAEYQRFCRSRRGEWRRDLSDDAARAELLDLARRSYVVSSIDTSMRTRVRDRRLGVDITTEATRRSPTLVRIVSVSARVEDGYRGSGRHGSGEPRCSVHGLGHLRRRDLDGELGPVEWRDHGAPNAWGPPPLRMLARKYPAEHRIWQWLAKHGVARPSEET